MTMNAEHGKAHTSLHKWKVLSRDEKTIFNMLAMLNLEYWTYKCIELEEKRQTDKRRERTTDGITALCTCTWFKGKKKVIHHFP